jgi:hypothetical protein
LDKFDNNYLCGFARRQDETRRIDTMMRLSELKTKAKSVRKNQELELSERSEIVKSRFSRKGWKLQLSFSS